MPYFIVGLLALIGAWCLEGGHSAVIRARAEAALLLIGGVCIGIAVNDLLHYLL